MQFAEDRGRPTYKVVKDPDMILDKVHKTNPPLLFFDMAQPQQVDPAVIVPDNTVSVNYLNTEAYLTIARLKILTPPLVRSVISLAMQLCSHLDSPFVGSPVLYRKRLKLKPELSPRER